MKTLGSVINKHYNEMMLEVVEAVGDDVFDLVVRVRTKNGRMFELCWLNRLEGNI